MKSYSDNHITPEEFLVLKKQVEQNIYLTNLALKAASISFIASFWILLYTIFGV